MQESGSSDNGVTTISSVLQSIASNRKIGFLIARDENAPADLLFMQRCVEICSSNGLPYIMKTGVWQENTYNAALELVDLGCVVIFSNNPANEDYLIQVAAEYPDVEFWQADGTKEVQAGMANYHSSNFVYGDENGRTEITLNVVHSNGLENKYTICTDESFLGDALRNLWLISGEESEYGYYVTIVDSEYADDSIQQWWCLKKNGAMVQTGVDDTELFNGDEYEFVLTTGF